MDFINISCTKLRQFMEENRTEWFGDNISLTELQLIKRRLYQCSPKIYAKMSRFFGLIEQTISRKK